MKLGIKYKLFLAILTANVLLALTMYGVSIWSFDKGFLHYVNQVEIKKLGPLVDALAEGYIEHQDWAWVARDGQKWHQLMRQFIVESNRHTGLAEDFPRGPPPPHESHSAPRPSEGFQAPPNNIRPPNGMAPPPGRPPPPGFTRRRGPEPLSFDPRLLLLDKDQALLIGGPQQKQEANLLPIRSGDKLFGYLGYLPRRQLSDQLDLIFLQQQNRTYAIIALGLIVISAMIAFPVAARLVEPIGKLAEGTRQLTSGDFKVRLNLTVKDELGQLANDFNTLAHTLGKNQRLRQQWIADISHELRTPLAVLKGEIEALQDGIRPLTPEAVNSLHQEVSHLNHLVNDLYELSLSDMGALSYNKERLDIVEILMDLRRQFEQELEENSIKDEWQIAQTHYVMADKARLTQLFTNLMQNTLRYTNQGGQLQIQMETRAQQLLIHWQDSAPAVAEKDLAKLFERFYRVEVSRNRRHGGSGLGLAICKNIVEAHNGTVDAQLSPLGGLWLTITLPQTEIPKG